MVRHCHRLPREMGDAPSLGTFQARLDGALSNLIQLKMSLLTAGGLDEVASKGPFQPNPFYDYPIMVKVCACELSTFLVCVGVHHHHELFEAAK